MCPNPPVGDQFLVDSLLRWDSLVPQLVKNLPAMWETWVQSLGWEDPLKKGKATHSSILSWRILWTLHGEVHGVAKSWTGLSNFHFHFAVIDTPLRTSFVNKCRDGSRSCPGVESLDHLGAERFQLQ